MLEWSWLQKSRLEWNLKDDRNTRFFHVIASSRQNRNELNSILVEEMVVEDPKQVKDVVWANFNRHFSEAWRIRPVLTGDFKSKVFKEDVMLCMKEFHSLGRLAFGMNSSFIALIPKKVNIVNLSKYRLINLIGSTYKILSKVLASKLKPVMPEKKAKKKGLLLKLDFEKAYDSINWGFLFSMLSNFGFGSKWISWMKEYISNARISVLVNGPPTKEFSPQKGLRLGDSLSPFLFNLAAEGLSILLLRARDMGLIKGMHIRVNGVVVSHLQFANDSLLFCETDVEEESKINFHYSVVCGVGILGNILKEFATLLNCKTQSIPLKFLGPPLGASPSRKKSWQPVIDKIKIRLAGWKRRLLSFVGKLTLIKSVLSSLLVIIYLSSGCQKELLRKLIDYKQLSCGEAHN
ncbi:uncharacterized protein LOC114276882 [Camellia sinensis]|uniref:uncharacterized protein LOC114276882 n=1 Tax=Camellia sinensis TaxID=4442 RepID=UPI0010357FB5|nr:uncharacterized protein LOC114276882 [Camellia sinensis]